MGAQYYVLDEPSYTGGETQIATLPQWRQQIPAMRTEWGEEFDERAFLACLIPLAEYIKRGGDPNHLIGCTGSTPLSDAAVQREMLPDKED